MTAIGENLRKAREERGLTLERVAEETNIAKRYLSALEAEDFSVFPGDPYAIGFLRNYADYLGLQADEFVAAFKNLRIQEQPVPIQELIPSTKPKKGLIIAIILGGLAVIGFASFLLFGRSKPDATLVEEERHLPVEYRVEGASFERRLYIGDSVLVTYGTEKYKLLVSRLDEAVSLETPFGAKRFSLGEEGLIDFNRDGQPELKILIADLDKKHPERGTLIRLELSGLGVASFPEAAPDAAVTTPPTETVASEQPIEPTPQGGSRNPVLFEAPKSPYPFVLFVTFRGPCMFRYEVDRRDRDERYYQKGETITVNANNAIKIWASNAQSAKVVIQASGGKSADVDLGAAGEVAVKRIAWTQNESGGYALSVFDVD